MKEFWYNALKEYLEVADAYDNPKTTKMFEIIELEEKRRIIRAVTHLRTYLIGWKCEYEDTDYGKGLVKGFLKILKAHGHRYGYMLEVGRLE